MGSATRCGPGRAKPEPNFRTFLSIVVSMNTIVFDQVPVLDLTGNPVNLSRHFERYLLLIFLRHLA
jgi:hypothetical protein